MISANCLQVADLSSEIHNIAQFIMDQLEYGTPKPILVSVCGGTSTCKSTLIAKKLKKEIGSDNTLIVELDYFQKGKYSDLTRSDIYGHDTPEYFQVNKCCHALKSMKEGRTTEIPHYEYMLGKHTGMDLLKPKPVIIAEGLFAGYAEIAALADYIIYVESPLYARLLRRMIRSCYERYRSEPSRAFRGIFSTLNSHNDLIIPQKLHANAVLYVPYKFEESIKRFDLNPLGITISDKEFNFKYQMSDMNFIGVYCENSELYIAIVHENRAYFNFQISEDFYQKFKDLDLDSL